MKKKTNKVKKVVISEKDGMVWLDNVRIQDVELLPEVIMATNKSPETHTDTEGNVVGYVNRVERTTAVNLRPEEFYKKEDK